MLVVYVSLLLSSLSQTLLAEDPLTSSLLKSKRGIVELGHNVAQDSKFYQPNLSSGYQSHQENQKLSPTYKSAEPSSYNPGYKYNHDSIHPQYSYHQGPVESSAHTRPLVPTYPAQIGGSGKYSLPSEGDLFTLTRDFKAVSEAATPSQQISSSERQTGGHHHQRVNPHSSSQGSFNRNKLGLPQSPHTFGFTTYSGIDQTQPEEAHRGFPSPALQAPVYKSTYPVGGHAPSIQTSARAPASPAKLIQSGAYNQAIGSAAGNINGKKIPVLQIESGKQHTGHSRAIESQPLVLSTGLDYQSSLPSAAGVQPSAPFFAPVSGFQTQVVPIQTSSSSPQFPQYRGARVQAYPVITNPSKTAPTYQALLAQPHLHFGGARAPPAPQSVKTQPGLGSYGTSGKIRSDVEIINKEKPKSTPLPPKKDEDGDNDKGIDHGFDVFDKQYGGSASQEDKSDDRGKSYSGPQIESDFKPSKSYPFKQYDDTFGKYSKSSSEENDKPDFKYTSYSSSSEEEVEQKSPSSKYSSSESSSYKSPYSRYEDQSGEEEGDKDASQSSVEQKSEYSYGPKSYKHLTKDYGQDSEESYRNGQKFKKYN